MVQNHWIAEPVQAAAVNPIKNVRRKAEQHDPGDIVRSGVIAEVCQCMLVMFARHVVEDVDSWSLFESPRRPDTHGHRCAVRSLTDKLSRL